MSVSVTIMAHKKRRKLVEDLKPQLDGAGAVWDKNDDRWDTGRRALLAFDPKATWHVVVQDDAILCEDFLPTVYKALDTLPKDDLMPVSFYTGKVRPYAGQIQDAVANAKRNGLTWFAMRGPLWGVAVAIPVLLIKKMVKECDESNTPNYDMRMAEWFFANQIPCWYSVPSLVDHRVGPDNPSLVPERGSGAGRVAWEFCEGSGLDIEWGSEAYVPGDPSSWWTEEGVCTRCWHRNDTLPEAVTHAYEKHGIGPIDFLASTLYHARDLWDLREAIVPAARGDFYVVGAEVSEKLDFPHTRFNRKNVRRKIGVRGGPFTIVGAARDLKFIGTRPGWSVVGAESN